MQQQRQISWPLVLLVWGVFLATRTASMMATTSTENNETLKPWSERWRNRRIGFHLKEVNPIIVDYASRLLGSSDYAPASEETATTTATTITSKQLHERVFVPLCGKTVDMVYLASLVSPSTQTAVRVVGLEGVRVALKEFIEEHPALKIKEMQAQTLGAERFEGETITLWKADYFDLSGGDGESDLSSFFHGSFGAIYDRASIVAIDPSLRQTYVRILDKLLVVGGRILLVALERRSSTSPEATSKGPPFSLPESTLRGLFDELEAEYRITVLQETDQLEENPEDKERFPDLDQLLETVYLIEKVETSGVTPDL